MIKPLLFALALSATLATPVRAEPLIVGPAAQVTAFENGAAAYQRGDYTTAFREFRPLAEQGYASAQFFVGALYGNGGGIAQDYAEAMRWYLLAAEQGLANAQERLGAQYFIGKGVPQDYIQGHMWSNLAAAQGREKAAKLREIIEERMTPADLSEAQRLAREWRPK